MDMLSLAVLGVVAIGLVGYSVWPRKRDEREVVKRRLAGGRAVDETAEIRERAGRWRPSSSSGGRRLCSPS